MSRMFAPHRSPPQESPISDCSVCGASGGRPDGINGYCWDCGRIACRRCMRVFGHEHRALCTRCLQFRGQIMYAGVPAASRGERLALPAARSPRHGSTPRLSPCHLCDELCAHVGTRSFHCFLCGLPSCARCGVLSLRTPAAICGLCSCAAAAWRESCTDPSLTATTIHTAPPERPSLAPIMSIIDEYWSQATAMAALPSPAAEASGHQLGPPGGSGGTLVAPSPAGPATVPSVAQPARHDTAPPVLVPATVLSRQERLHLPRRAPPPPSLRLLARTASPEPPCAHRALPSQSDPLQPGLPPCAPPIPLHSGYWGPPAHGPPPLTSPAAHAACALPAYTAPQGWPAASAHHSQTPAAPPGLIPPCPAHSMCPAGTHGLGPPPPPATVAHACPTGGPAPPWDPWAGAPEVGATALTVAGSSPLRAPCAPAHCLAAPGLVQMTPVAPKSTPQATFDPWNPTPWPPPPQHNSWPAGGSPPPPQSYDPWAPDPRP